MDSYVLNYTAPFNMTNKNKIYMYIYLFIDFLVFNKLNTNVQYQIYRVVITTVLTIITLKMRLMEATFSLLSM